MFSKSKKSVHKMKNSSQEKATLQPQALSKVDKKSSVQRKEKQRNRSQRKANLTLVGSSSSAPAQSAANKPAAQSTAEKPAVQSTAKRPDTLDFETMVMIMGGHTAFQLMWAGIELGVFDHLHAHPGATFAQLKEATGLEHRPLRVLMTGVATLKLVLKDGDHFRNAKTTNELLVRSQNGNWVQMLGWQRHIVYPGLVDFVDSLKANANLGLRNFKGTEDNLYARLSHDKKLEKIFQDAMSSLSLSANTMLAEKVPLQGVKHLVDCGGGDGTNAMQIAKHNPHLKVTVFDRASVCEIARKNIERQGFAARVGTHEGDLFSTKFPKDIDAVLLAHLLTIWSPENNIKLLRRVHEALAPGGRVLIFNMIGHDDQVGPMTTALGSPYFLAIATGEGMLYSGAEIEEFLHQAGFQKTERLTLPRDHMVLVGIK